MTNEAKQIFLSIAPLFVEKGIALQERVAAAGGDPAKCTVGGKPIIEAYAASAKEWAETFARVIETKHYDELIGRTIRIRYNNINDSSAVSNGRVTYIQERDFGNVIIFISGYQFKLTEPEIAELMENGEVSLCDWHLTLVNE